MLRAAVAVFVVMGCGGQTPSHHAESPEHSHHGSGPDGYAMDFSDTERFAQHFEDPTRDAWQMPLVVVEHLLVSPGQRVADIGAGTGYFLPYLSRAVGEEGRVLALDVEPAMVKHLEQRIEEAQMKNVSAARVAPDDPALPSRSVDRILTVNTWHHISGRVAYAAKLEQALQPGGSVLVVDFTLESDVGPPMDHRLTAQQVADELRAGGLEAIIVETEQLPRQYIVRGTKRTP